jgi:hypothetical protein
LKHERLKQVSECENRISNFKTEMEKRKKQLLEKAKTKEHVNMILYEFNKPDYTYIQLLENLYKVKNQMVVKTRSEILSEMQSVLENLLF